MIRFILLLLLLSCFDNVGAQQLADNTFLSYTKGNFSIQYPSSWQLDTTGRMGAQVFAFSPVQGPGDIFRENANVLIQNLGGQNIDLQKYKEISEQQTKQMVGGKLLASKIVQSNGRDQYQMIYEITQGPLQLRAISVCYISNDKAYLATFTAEAGQYDAYQEVMKTIIGSFVLKQ